MRCLTSADIHSIFIDFPQTGDHHALDGMMIQVVCGQLDFFSSIGDSKPLQVLYVPRAPNDLYFWRSTPSKTSPFPTKNGAVNCPTTCRLHLSFLRWNNPYNLLLTIRYPALAPQSISQNFRQSRHNALTAKDYSCGFGDCKSKFAVILFLSACLVSILINCVSLFSEISFWDPF